MDHEQRIARARARLAPYIDVADYDYHEPAVVELLVDVLLLCRRDGPDVDYCLALAGEAVEMVTEDD